MTSKALPTKTELQLTLLNHAKYLCNMYGVFHGRGVGEGAWSFRGRYGQCIISPSVDTLQFKKPPSITLFGKFNDAWLAIHEGFAECSQYTGKWNHHGLTKQLEIEHIINQLVK